MWKSLQQLQFYHPLGKKNCHDVRISGKQKYHNDVRMTPFSSHNSWTWGIFTYDNHCSVYLVQPVQYWKNYFLLLYYSAWKEIHCKRSPTYGTYYEFSLVHFSLAYMFGISEERFLFHTNCVLEALFEKAPQIISFPDKCDLHSFSQRFDEIGRWVELILPSALIENVENIHVSLFMPCIQSLWSPFQN